MVSKKEQLSRRGFLGAVLRDAARIATTVGAGNDAKDEIDSMLADFESLPIASTYPWELFEDEAKRMGIDCEKVGKAEAIKRIIACQMKRNPPDAPGRSVPSRQFDSQAHFDPATDVCSIFDAVFRLVMPSESARRLFAIKGISEKCSGDPGWYLWFEDKPGAYLLELAEADYHETGGSGAPDGLQGVFQIKYYPDPSDDELFSTFSFAEQYVRMGHSFDKSGTPVFEAQSEMNDSLFTVGRLDIRLNGNGEALEFALSAPDRWVSRHTGGCKVKDGRGVETEVLQPGEIDRNAPAWALSWWFFDRLVSAFCYAKKTAPIVASLFSKEGKGFEIGDCGITAKRCAEQDIRSSHWLFPSVRESGRIR